MAVVPRVIVAAVAKTAVGMAGRQTTREKWPYIVFALGNEKRKMFEFFFRFLFLP